MLLPDLRWEEEERRGGTGSSLFGTPPPAPPVSMPRPAGGASSSSTGGGDGTAAAAAEDRRPPPPPPPGLPPPTPPALEAPSEDTSLAASALPTEMPSALLATMPCSEAIPSAALSSAASSSVPPSGEMPSALLAAVPSTSVLSAVDLPRKRKGEAEDRQSLEVEMDEDLSRSEDDDQHPKIRCYRAPHSQIEKRRRDKMNHLIDELSSMIPACIPMSRKLDKLTVLRKAVQHLKALKAGTSSIFPDSTYKLSFLSDDDLKKLVLKAADGFLLVVSCDRGKIIFISESVSKILNFNRLELVGQSIFDYIHHKDIGKVKEQLSPYENPHDRLIDANTGLQVRADSPVGAAHLSTGARRSFFCRMKHSRVHGKTEDKHTLPSTSKRKDSHRYCTVHCTGYMRSWPTGLLDVECEADKQSSRLACLVTMCRVHHPPHHSTPPSSSTAQILPPPSSTEVHVKPTQFVTRCGIDGKFTFVDQQATTITGYLPQELLGTSCYEYFHRDDLQYLAEKHRQVLRSKEKIETNRYKFKTKNGSYISLQSQWFSFINPWTKDVEFIVSMNRVLSGPSHTEGSEQPGHSKALQQDDTKWIPPIIPGISSESDTMIYAGSIGTQIANELIDSNRVSSSPSSGSASPFVSIQDKSSIVPPPRTSRTAASKESESSSDSAEPSSSNQPAATTGETPSSSSFSSSQVDLENMVVPGLCTFSSDDAAMAVIMSLLESDASLGQTQAEDFDDIQWPV